jgi:hypothetical protein
MLVPSFRTEVSIRVAMSGLRVAVIFGRSSRGNPDPAPGINPRRSPPLPHKLNLLCSITYSVPLLSELVSLAHVRAYMIYKNT